MNEHIVVDSKIHFGKPTIKNTRITVQNVLELINEGISFEEIIADYYPDLTISDIHSSIDYAISLVAAEDIKIAA